MTIDIESESIKRFLYERYFLEIGIQHMGHRLWPARKFITRERKIKPKRKKNSARSAQRMQTVRGPTSDYVEFFLGLPRFRFPVTASSSAPSAPSVGSGFCFGGLPRLRFGAGSTSDSLGSLAYHGGRLWRTTPLLLRGTV
ncbi:hypothetical protein C8R42DRAFT_428177 [Lentinula raphanica]|nr:hypothetical protein C8R42DRAFT_428177 [Lentinula raphanica]